MKKILTLLLAGAALIPSFSHAYQPSNVCAENVYIDSVSIPDNDSGHDTNNQSWSISYTLSTGQAHTIVAKSTGNLKLDSAQGRATYALAMNAMNMRQPVRIIDLSYENYGDRCYDFDMLTVGNIK